MRNTLQLALLCSALGTGGRALATEDEIGRLDRLPEASAGVQVQARPVRATDGRGLIGFRACARTSRIESRPIAATGDAVAVVTPHFSRSEGDILRGAGWTIEIDTMLRKPALAGNTVFKFVDVADIKGNEERDHHSRDERYTASFQTRVPKTDRLAAQMTLGLEDGFQPGHTYRLSVVQLVHRAEVVLAESEFSLE